MGRHGQLKPYLPPWASCTHELQHRSNPACCDEVELRLSPRGFSIGHLICVTLDPLACQMHTLRSIWWYPGSTTQDIGQRQAGGAIHLQKTLRLADGHGLRPAGPQEFQLRWLATRRITRRSKCLGSGEWDGGRLSPMPPERRKGPCGVDHEPRAIMLAQSLMAIIAEKVVLRQGHGLPWPTRCAQEAV